MAEAFEIDPAGALERQRAGALIIDVRDPDEWDDGHVDGAVLIPLGELAERQREIPRDRDVIMMCQSGRRSAKAQRQLSDDSDSRRRISPAE